MIHLPIDKNDSTSESWSMPAPVGGWNARDAYAVMPRECAIQLDNWFPGTTALEVRKGSTTAATLPAGQFVKSLMGIAKQDGTYLRFAGSQAGIYNITPGGAIAAVSSAATTGLWESVQINVSGASWLWCCAGDGVNKSRGYNATTNTWTIFDGASVPAITGITSENVSNVALWKYRLILCERDSLKFYYGPLTSVGGAFTGFDLGQIFKKGGYLVATASWTVDAGDGADDRFVAITSEGEIAIYQGTDPSAAASFFLVGVYDVGKPVGKRCFVKLAGDLGVLTEQGLWPLSKALENATLRKDLALTDVIQAAFNGYFTTYGPIHGWQAVLLPKAPAIVVNIPLGAQASYQFVMNTITGAWARFTNWNAEAMLVLDGKLYFGANNTIKEGWVGSDDDGASITATCAQAYTYGPAARRAKQIKLVRPILQTTSNDLKVLLKIATDFDAVKTLTPALSSASGSSLWDTAIWDTAVWGGAFNSHRNWKSVFNRPGRAYSLQLGVQTKSVSAVWMATDFIGEAGRVSLA